MGGVTQTNVVIPFYCQRTLCCGASLSMAAARPVACEKEAILSMLVNQLSKLADNLLRVRLETYWRNRAGEIGPRIQGFNKV
jgi:hypothetical protein